MPPPKCLDLEKLNPEAVARLAASATLRGKLVDMRPAIWFWTSRRTSGRWVDVLGSPEGVHGMVRGKVSDAGDLQRPDNAAHWVRVSAGDLHAWGLKYHPVVTRSTEAAVRAVLMQARKSGADMRSKALEVASMLEHLALRGIIEELPPQPIRDPDSRIAELERAGLKVLHDKQTVSAFEAAIMAPKKVH